MIAKPIAVLLATFIFCLPSVGDAKVLVGDKFPEIRLNYLEKNEQFKLDRHKSKIMLIDIWASDCYPCRQALPALNKLYKKLKTKGFEIIGVSVYEDIPATREFLKEYRVDYTILDDSKHELAKSLGVSQMPTSYLIDQERVVRYIHKGFKSGDGEIIEAEINKLLSKGAGKPKKSSKN